jgi:uncharacterized cupredoxin-like copper-binding protein
MRDHDSRLKTPGCIPDESTLSSMRRAAGLEAMITDPVYEGKSMAGLIDRVSRGEIDERRTSCMRTSAASRRSMGTRASLADQPIDPLPKGGERIRWWRLCRVQSFGHPWNATNGTSAARGSFLGCATTHREGIPMHRFASLIAAAFLLASCAGAPTGAKGSSITIVETEMRFSPNRIDAKVGQPVAVTIVNQGSQRHDFAFPSLNMPSLQGIETALEPGQSTTITLQFDQPGTYVFICTLEGHMSSGMSGAAFVTQ